ncbi:bifunctional adenosylcobinamide kinase/adenosylcobinamide-phosphate guanylyltransferase [Plantactinospora siamensis]|uniref:Adenosylcobinamide kinase n=1 Tax=Plantactinospora siamensis TaxID=555372 RepID=A0ABV6P1D6_9ACTN
MSVDGWNSLLVLGGIRSGKSEFAESLLGDADRVRYLATAADAGPDDPEWTARIAAHRGRRPQAWETEEAAADPARLIQLLTEARPGETLLVDDLGGWVTVLLDPAHQPADDVATIEELARAVQGCAARLVLVSPEVGLSLVPTTPLGRAFADALGAVNQAVAAACDAVALVVAGQPAWLKPEGGAGRRPAAGPIDAAGRPIPLPTQTGVPTQTGTASQTGTATRTGTASRTGAPGPAAAGVPDGVEPAGESPDVLTPAVAPPATSAPPPGPGWAAPTMTLPMLATGLVIQPGMELPLPDEFAGPRAVDRLATLDLPGAGLGNLDRVVGFAAGTQGVPVPEPWRNIRVLLVHGDHSGGAAAGVAPGESGRRADQARAGEGPLARLAAEVDAGLQVIDAPTAAPIEEEAALTDAAVESALRYGWRLAEEAADAGVQLLVLAACGAGADAAAAAVLAATAGAEPAAVLGRVVTAGGGVDDTAWMRRCSAVRDALHRTRRSSRGPREILAELAGGDIAIATGVLLGATARRLPVLLDGPVGVSAALITRDLAGQARHWCLLPDHGGHPAVRLATDVLGLTPLFDLRLDLGEGATALAALPLLRSALTLARSLPAHPRLGGADPAAGAGDWSPAEEDAGTGGWSPARDEAGTGTDAWSPSKEGASADAWSSSEQGASAGAWSSSEEEAGATASRSPTGEDDGGHGAGAAGENTTEPHPTDPHPTEPAPTEPASTEPDFVEPDDAGPGPADPDRPESPPGAGHPQGLGADPADARTPHGG